MVIDNTMSQEELIGHLNTLAQDALPLWDIGDGATARLINVSENATYIVDAPNANDPGMEKTILRVHRENYHSKNAIGCELAWLDALRDEGGVITPHAFVGRDGNRIQTHSIDTLPNPRHMVLFEFVSGLEPDESQDLINPFEGLGELAARTHEHSIAWLRPDNFERLVWDLDTVFGADPTWGNWRDGPRVEGAVRNTLEKVERVVTEKLTAFGKGSDRYGLIHADMRLANLLIDNGSTRLIDFDDCGLGWFLYDFAAGISFMEDHPQIPALKNAWVKGYRKMRALSDEEEAEIDTFIMLRRMALVAWMGSHPEVDVVIEMEPDFARISAELGEEYLRKTG